MQPNYRPHAAIAQNLRSLIQDLGYTVRTTADGYQVAGEQLSEVGQALSRVAAKEPPWGRSYMHHALNGRQGSQRLHDAILTLGAQLDGHSPILANTEQQRVYARPGQLLPNTVILPDAKRCAGCSIPFVPRVPWQKYCDRNCPRR